MLTLLMSIVLTGLLLTLMEGILELKLEIRELKGGKEFKKKKTGEQDRRQVPLDNK